MVNFEVNIEPMGAVRMTGRGKFVKEAAQRYLSYKGLIGNVASMKVKEPIEGPIKVVINFFYPIPKRFTKAQKLLAVKRMIAPTVKPDIDNCIKGVFDALNKIAWNDDNQVARVISSKWYSDNPRIEVTIDHLTFEEVTA